MNGNNTVPGAAPAGAVPASGYYSRPDLWVDAQKYTDEADATYLRLKHLEGGLQTRSKEIEGMGNALKYLQYRLEIAAKTGDDALIENARQRYDQMYERYKFARMDYARNYGEYSRAYSGYEAAWNAQNDYVTSQKEAEKQWRSTIRDPETVRSELAAIEGQIAAQRETDRAKRQAEYEAAQKAKPWYEKLAGYLGEAQDTTLPTYTNQGANVGGNSPELQALLEQQKLLQEEYEWGMYLPYADLMQKADFAEKSQYKSTYRGGEQFNALSGTYTDTGFDDIAYDYINRDETARNRQSVADLQSNAALLGLDNSERGEMTKDEIAIFNYLYATQGKEAAYEYIEYLTSDLNARQRKAEQKRWAEYAKAKPGAASAFSVMMSPMKGLSYLGQAADYFADGKIDQNAGYNKFSYIPSAIRNQRAEDIKASAKTEFWGSVGSFGYQTAMSMADFLTTTLISGGNTALATTIMGSGAAADTVIDAKDRGLSDNQAFALGTIAGVAEALAEKKSLSSLLDLSKLEKSAWGYVFKNMWDEGMEEVTTSLVNTIADVLISQDKSQWQQAIDAYMAQGKTEGQAFGLALADQAVALGLDAMGGALSGGVMAGGNVAINKGTAAILGRLDKRAQATAPATFQEEVQRQVAENMAPVKPAQGTVDTDRALGYDNIVNETKGGDISNEGREETREAFHRRTHEKKYTVRERGEIASAFNPAVDKTERAGRTEKALQELGIQVIVHEGLEVNVAGKTRLIQGESTCVGGDAVYVRNSMETDPMETAGHEAYHFWKHTDARIAYKEVVEDNIDFASDAFVDFQQKIEKAYFEGEVGIDDDGVDKLTEEIFAYITGLIHSGNGESIVRPFLRDYDAVKAAWDTLAHSQASTTAPATFQEEVQRQVTENLGGKKAAQGATAQLAAPTVQVNQEAWQQGQRLAQITGRNIKFYEGKSSENGFFDPKTGEIWVNAKGGDPLAQVFSHELTHSIEKAGGYEKLSALVLNRMQDTGMDLDTAREAKRQQYQRQNKPLPTQAAVDQELVAEYVSKHLLTDEQQIVSLVQQDRSLGQKIHDFFDRLLAKLGNKNAQERAFLSRAKNIYAKALRQTQNVGTAQTVEQTATAATEGADAEGISLDDLDAQLAAGEITEEEYDGIREEYERWQEEQYSAGERKYSVGSATNQYDYSKPFAEQLADYKNGKIPKGDTLIVGGTPEVFQKIGMASLPVTINSTHIDYALNGTKDFDHHIGQSLLEQLPESIKKPVAVMTSGTKANSSVVAMLEIRHNGKQIVVPVAVNGFGRQNGILIDSNAITSVYGKNRSISRVLYDAIVEEGAGQFRLFYLDKNKATALLQKARVPMPKNSAIHNGGFIHSLSDAGSPVKSRFSDITLSQQFKRWFGDWQNHPENASKIVNADGTPKVMYHGTKVENGDFYVFDESKAVKKGGLGLKALGKGNYFTSKKLDGTERYGSRVISAYLNIRNPFIYNSGSSFREQVAKELNIDTKLSADALQQEMRRRGYDGVVQHDTNGEVSIAVTFDSHQIKSATDNIGTFDGGNPDIRYSLADEDAGQEDTPEQILQKAKSLRIPVWMYLDRNKDRYFVDGKRTAAAAEAMKLGFSDSEMIDITSGFLNGPEINERLAELRKQDINSQPKTAREFTHKEPAKDLHNSMPLSQQPGHIPKEVTRQKSEEKSNIRDTMPKKAKAILDTAERTMLQEVTRALHVPSLASEAYLTPVVQELSDIYLDKGTLTEEDIGLLFDKFYANGVVACKEYLEKYSQVAERLHGTALTPTKAEWNAIFNQKSFKEGAQGKIRIVPSGGMTIAEAYQMAQGLQPDLFPADIETAHSQAWRLVYAVQNAQLASNRMEQVKTDSEAKFRENERGDFNKAVSAVMSKLWEVKRFAEEKVAKEKEPAPATEQEAMEAYKKLKQARRELDKVNAKNLLTQRDQMQVGRLLRHEILPEHLKEGKDNVKGILAVFQAKQEYERLCKLVAEYKRYLRGKARAEADELLKTANSWKDKKVGIAYSRETMERNVMDIIEDKVLAQQVIDKYFTPVHTSEAASTRFKQEYRDRVRKLNISRKVQKGNLVSEAYAVQLLGEAQDNIRMLENARGRIKQRDGKNRSEWEAVIGKLWEENPLLDRGKIENAVKEFRKIYDELFQQMNQVRVANGYEPVNYRQGYFPHFQAGDSDSILAQFGRALGIDTRIDVLPTTINGMTHAFKPGIQWFGNAQERLGFETAYDAVEGFDKYIEGVANVIFHTQNIQNLRAFASQIRYRTSDEGIRKQVDEIYERQGLTDEEKQQLITEIYAHGKFALSGFVAELDEYTNLLAGKKSRYDRAIEAAMGRKAYSVLKAWESRVAANMIAGNLTSALTNFIPWTQAGAQVGYIRLLRGVEQTLRATRSDDGFAGGSTFLTNRRGVDPLVQTWAQKASGIASKPMELIDSLVSESIVRAAYEQNRQQGLSEAEAMAQADAFAAGVMADRSKGATPTLFHSTNPLMKAFTQFQLEVNNQFSEVFKDIPRRYRDKKLRELVWVLLKYFLGAWLYNWLYEKLIGRRPALDPIGMLCQFGEDWKEDGFGEAVINLGNSALEQLPFSAGLTIVGIEIEGGRIPATSAVPNFADSLKAIFSRDMSPEKRWKEVQDELSKLWYVAPPLAGNQISKIWKGLKAYFQGGSYTIEDVPIKDEEGNIIGVKGMPSLQYPVYKDNPGDAFASFVKATILGKSALGAAQEWVDKGFNSLGAKQTAAYQDMLEAGVSDREAYELIRQISDAKETDTMKKAAVQRDVLRKSQVSGDGKAIVYYGLMASEKEWAIMDRLADMGADAGAVTDALMDMADVRAKDGSKQADVLAVISKAVLTDEEKAVLVGSVIGTEMLTEEGNLTQYAKFDYAVQNGMGVDQYIQYRASGASIDDYLELRDAGATVEEAMEAAMALQEMKDSVENPSTVQKWKAVIAGVDDPERQMVSLSVVMSDNQYAKLTTARGFGVSPADFVSANEKIAKYDRDGNGRLTQAEVTQGISNLRLTLQQKAVLWQLITGSSSAKNNPYSQAIGERVIAALEKAKAEGKKPGLSFQDEIMRQIMANMGK